ncbi:MAG: hypothetical protein IKM12_06115 [Alistipes sp.]|nr:hypothetical protein [Alistipes sp.]
MLPLFRASPSVQPMAFAIKANLTHPLNPPPQAGDFGRYAPGDMFPQVG